jgi:hypothetical protein
MAAGQRSAGGATTGPDEEKARRDETSNSREKAQRPPDQGVETTGVGAEEHKNNPAKQRPEQDNAERPGRGEDGTEEVDRPGFDLGGSTGETSAGRGLGLDTDAKDDRKDWRLPRGDKRS